MLLTTLELTAATAQLKGAELQYSSLPASYPLPNVFDFSVRITRPLFRYAYQCAESGRFWTAFPGLDDMETTRATSRTDTVLCPADNPLYGFFAAR